jgi:uncharacterized protein (DUF1800 family)
MNSKKSDKFLQTLRTFLVIFGLAFPVFAETDTNPNSPTPILLTEQNSTRAIATNKPDNSLFKNLPSKQTDSFDLNSNVVLYLTNIELTTGEGKNAFRVYVEDSRGRKYRFPVLDLKLIDAKNRIYALVTELKDEIGFWNEPPEKGDISVSVTWRGLASNSVRLSLGVTKDTIQTKSYPTDKNEVEPPNYVGDRFSGDRVRFMEQATFGPTDALEQRIRRIGIRSWLADQFEKPYPTIPYPNLPLMPTTPPPNCNGQIDSGVPDPDPLCFVNQYSMYPAQNWFYKEAFYGDAQLRHRIAWTLAQLWVVSGVETQQSSYLTAYYKVLSRNAFGNWRNLMQEVTLNPGMGNYLNMRTSTKFNPNENYAREVLQLFNIGLFMLNPDGTLQLDAQNNPIPTYNQDTVYNFSLLFTGWSLCEISQLQCPNRSIGSPNYIDPMIITNPGIHDLSAKTLLDYRGSTTTNVPACSDCTGTAITAYANNSLNQALDNIYNHPNTAPFVSKFLIQQLVTGDPTPAYVERISAVFNANRTNPTQLKEVIKAILLDPEARGDEKTDSRYGKLREPVQLLTNLARRFNAASADRTTQSDGVVTTETASMGQTVFMSPTVFNFFPPTYIVPGTSLNGPEFGLFTSGTSIARTNLINTLVFNRININTNRKVTSGTSISLTDLQEYAAIDPSGNLLLDQLNSKMMHGAMSAEMRNTIRTAILTVPQSNPLLRTQRAVYLTATSSQYQVQR